MAIDSRNYYYRVTIEGVQVDYAGEMVMNESLDGLTSVVEFELIDQISPRADYGDVVVVTRLNRSDDTAQYQFKGTIREFVLNHVRLKRRAFRRIYSRSLPRIRSDRFRPSATITVIAAYVGRPPNSPGRLH